MRLDHQLLVLLLKHSLEFAYYLVDDVVDVRPTLGSANAVDEGHLLELPVAQACSNFPSRMFHLCDLWEIGIV